MTLELTINGNPFGQSGYAIHTSELSKALMAAGHDVSILPDSLPQNWQMMAHPKIREAITQDGQFNKKNPFVMIKMADWWPSHFGDRLEKLIGFGVFEGTEVPYNWYKNAADKRIYQLWTPSMHTRAAFGKATLTNHLKNNSEFMDKTKVISHGINPKLFNPNIEPIQDFDNPNDKYVFTFVGGWTQGMNDRKGLQFALKAFCEEFTPKDDVMFFVKINSCYAPGQNTEAELDKLGLPKKKPEIKLFTKNIPYEAMGSIYKCGDAIIQPTMAEGFNMCLAEAMACGLTAITTNYGGQMDYCFQNNSMLVGSKMIPSPGQPSCLYEQCKWAEPSIPELRSHMRNCYENREFADKIGAKGSEFIHDNFTWAHTVAKIEKALE